MSRPNFEDIKSGEEFNNWYWLKEEMVAICKKTGLPHTGRKFDLRDRIIYALDQPGKVKHVPKKQKTKSSFNWVKESLTLETKITDNVSFGPNFRAFMKSQLGDKFSCHSDFMDWMKSNVGKTLQDAIEQYRLFEIRKKDPNFKRSIAESNMYNQYTRDFMKDNPNESLKNLRRCWMLKKQLPTKDGFVRYERSDLEL
ncbi:DUF6434 domain-containing protein [uncultured Algoriphagus sp.]|uniref:DUF6434 domain-containing protein n=1 Tax=uncultured Algoriphagus sp. TaxID=417365 RepID=UPI0025966588|nr:DUF6434 domain-containing protein [uncultured Algoriphagus sp.]